MDARSQQQRAGFAPVIATAIVAIAGAAGFFFFALSPRTNLDHGGINMVTEAAAERAGATVLPTDPM